MGLFKKKVKQVKQEVKQVKEVKQQVKQVKKEQLEDGDLPWGWIARNREFIDKVQKEDSYFLHAWLDARKKSKKDEYAALKSFVIHLEDLEKLCKAKGECFDFWFHEILITPDYIQKRKAELKELEENLEELIKKDDRQQYININILPTLEKDLLALISQKGEILQTELYKEFPEDIKEYVKEHLYFLARDNKIVREKSGRTYLLKAK